MTLYGEKRGIELSLYKSVTQHKLNRVTKADNQIILLAIVNVLQGLSLHTQFFFKLNSPLGDGGIYESYEVRWYVCR